MLGPQFSIHQDKVIRPNNFSPELKDDLVKMGVLDVESYLNKISNNAKFISVWNLKENCMIAFIAYYKKEEYAFVTMLWVDEQHRTKGFGQSMLEVLINLDFPEIRLEAKKSSQAMNFYKKNGFYEHYVNASSEKVLLRRVTSIAVMQPYFFPALQYFKLMHATRFFVFLDDVNFRKKGWINRNYVTYFSNSDEKILINVPLSKISQNVQIFRTKIYSSEWKSSFLAKISHCYSKAPYFDEVMPILNKFVSLDFQSISELAITSNLLVNEYLEVNKETGQSSISCQTILGKTPQDRIINIVKHLEGRHYVNAVGGKGIYSKKYFEEKDLKLHFLAEQDTSQFPLSSLTPEIARFSIIDDLMRFSKEEIRIKLLDYSFE